MVVCVGRLKERFYIDAAAEYAKRLGRYCRLEIVELPEELIAVLVSPAEDLEQAELQEVLLQHRDTPVPARPRTVRRAQ